MDGVEADRADGADGYVGDDVWERRGWGEDEAEEVDEEGGNKESANRSRDLFIFFDALLFIYRTGVYSKYDLWLEGG